MAGMAPKRTTVVLSQADQRALAEASKREGLSQSELIRKGIRAVTATYRKKARPRTGWLDLSAAELKKIDAEDFGDYES